MKIVKKILIISIIVILIMMFAGFIVIQTITADTDLDEQKLVTSGENLIIYDVNSNKVNLNIKNAIALEDISNNIIDAFVALEDKRFFEHNGLDYKRIIGAGLNNIKSFSFKEGASTISQQLIKNTHLSNEKTITRKLKEAKLAVKLEKQYSKSQILEMYLNVIYFGSGIYGVENASKAYFNKKPIDLTISESAMLAGVVKNPRAYSPILNYENSINRRNIVLDVMYKQNKMDKGTLNKAKNENITIKNGLIKNNINQSYITNVVFEASKILNIPEAELINGGYKIKTYLNQPTQKEVYRLLKDKNLNPVSAENAAMCLDNSTLGVSAYYNSLNLPDEFIKRSGGSTLKPFTVYAPALESNLYTSQTQILDEPININGYSPKNYNDANYGWVSVREALKKSMNVPAVKILDSLGIENSVNFCNKMGFEFDNYKNNLSLALGSANINPLKLSGAYAMLANGGNHCNAQFIDEIKNSKNQVVYKRNIFKPRVMSEENAFILTNMLQDVVNDGTCQKLKHLGFDISAKSGTVAFQNTKQNTDAWCASYTTQNTFLVWMGSLDNKKEHLMPSIISGGSYPAMINARIAESYYSTSPPNFIKPERVNLVALDKDELLNNKKIVKANFATSNIMYDYFTMLNEPEETKLDYFSDININESNKSISISFSGYHNLDYKVYKRHFFGYSLMDNLIYQNQRYYILDTNPSNFFKNHYRIVVQDKIYDITVD